MYHIWLFHWSTGVASHTAFSCLVGELLVIKLVAGAIIDVIDSFKVKDVYTLDLSVWHLLNKLTIRLWFDTRTIFLHSRC